MLSMVGKRSIRTNLAGQNKKQHPFGCCFFTAINQERLLLLFDDRIESLRFLLPYEDPHDDL